MENKTGERNSWPIWCKRTKCVHTIVQEFTDSIWNLVCFIFSVSIHLYLNLFLISTIHLSSYHYIRVYATLVWGCHFYTLLLLFTTVLFCNRFSECSYLYNIKLLKRNSYDSILKLYIRLTLYTYKRPSRRFEWLNLINAEKKKNVQCRSVSHTRVVINNIAIGWNSIFFHLSLFPPLTLLHNI